MNSLIFAFVCIGAISVVACVAATILTYRVNLR